MYYQKSRNHQIQYQDLVSIQRFKQRNQQIAGLSNQIQNSAEKPTHLKNNNSSRIYRSPNQTSRVQQINIGSQTYRKSSVNTKLDQLRSISRFSICSIKPYEKQSTKQFCNINLGQKSILQPELEKPSDSLLSWVRYRHSMSSLVENKEHLNSQKVFEASDSNLSSGNGPLDSFMKRQSNELNQAYLNKIKNRSHTLSKVKIKLEKLRQNSQISYKFDPSKEGRLNKFCQSRIDQIQAQQYENKITSLEYLLNKKHGFNTLRYCISSGKLNKSVQNLINIYQKRKYVDQNLQETEKQDFVLEYRKSISYQGQRNLLDCDSTEQ